LGTGSPWEAGAFKNEQTKEKRDEISEEDS
jgi:hypothetical protein